MSARVAAVRRDQRWRVRTYAEAAATVDAFQAVGSVADVWVAWALFYEKEAHPLLRADEEDEEERGGGSEDGHD